MTYTVRYGPSGDIAEITVQLPDGTRVTIAEDALVRVWSAGGLPLALTTSRDGLITVRTLHVVPPDVR